MPRHLDQGSHHLQVDERDLGVKVWANRSGASTYLVHSPSVVLHVSRDAQTASWVTAPVSQQSRQPAKGALPGWRI